MIKNFIEKLDVAGTIALLVIIGAFVLICIFAVSGIPENETMRAILLLYFGWGGQIIGNLFGGLRREVVSPLPPPEPPKV